MYPQSAHLCKAKIENNLFKGNLLNPFILVKAPSYNMTHVHTFITYVTLIVHKLHVKYIYA